MSAVVTRRPSGRVYIACQDMDFAWSRGCVDLVIRWWQRGMPLADMADKLGRDSDEVAILLIDLARRGRITKEGYGVMGHGR